MEARCCHHGHNIISWCYFCVHQLYIVSLQVFENALSPNGEEPPLWRHVVVTVVITLLVGAISMTTDCLGIVLELNVSTIIFINLKSNTNHNCNCFCCCNSLNV